MQFDRLNKGGDRCSAAEGEIKYHAIFGGGSCCIVRRSDIAPRLYLLDGRLVLHDEWFAFWSLVFCICERS